MNPALIWDAFAGAMKAANAILSFIPALVWAVALAISTGYGALMHHERDSAVSERNVVQAVYEQLTVKVLRQKAEAMALYKKLVAERDSVQAELNKVHADQEVQSENRRIQSQAAGAALARDAAAHGGQLRDPNSPGRGSGGAGPEGHAATPAQAGAGNAAEAGGLFSVGASQLLERLTREADEVNDAYAACRADAVTVRKAVEAAP